MKKEIAIVALGELLIDFTEAGISKNGMKLFEQNPGGAPANLLTVASHMGYRTSFIGKIGTDMHGDFLKKTLQNEGIDTGALVEDERYFTTLAFVEIDENGERKFLLREEAGSGYPAGSKRSGSKAALRLQNLSFWIPVSHTGAVERHDAGGSPDRKRGWCADLLRSELPRVALGGYGDRCGADEGGDPSGGCDEGI